MFGSKLQFSRVVARFAQDERGGLMIFSLFIMVCMLLAVGISIDVMRTEVMRTRLQNVSDRAVLAAADLEQTLSAEEVVRDYFAREGLEEYLTGVTVSESANEKTVSIAASTDVPSMFLNMVGISSLNAPATGTATESVTDVELSIVLDISGSMGSNNKIGNLRTAAKEFVDTVIRPETPGAVSISLVPYTAQVNAGPTLMSFLNVTQEHNYSHCINFEDTDFDTTTISLTQEYEHTQHFSRYNVASGTVWNPACPQQDFERITAFSEDATALKAQLDQFQARAHTSIHLGLKWGTALLDPSFAPVVSSMAATGEAGAAFADRPYAYNRPNTLKAVVLMTDGINVNTRKIAPWAYDTAAEREAFHNGSVYQVANDWGVSVNSFFETAYTPATADDMLENICDAAKAQGIIIYTIGFEVTAASAQVMEDCASTPANFYLVDGVEIVDAFASIARQINQLRLTQ